MKLADSEEEVVLDNSMSPSGPGRYFIDYERERVPVAVQMSNARPFLGYPLHETVCVKAAAAR